HSISITPDGSIYVCQGFVGFEQYKIGTIYTGINYDKLEEFGEKWVQYLKKCSECWVRYSCSVACVAQGLIIEGLESKKPTKICDFSKRVFEASAYLYSKLLDEKPELFNTYNKEKIL
ncbi:MAG: SPASM domain-containing protein, partial [Melioribacter sp.]|nr:SPASM domain-containing protein [Melioribacter sp.]